MSELEDAMDVSQGRGWVTPDGKHQVDILRDEVTTLRARIEQLEMKLEDGYKDDLFDGSRIWGDDL